MRVMTLCLTVILLCGLAAWAQDSPKGPPSSEEPGYGQGRYAVDDDIIGSPWRDPVHWFGIAGGMVAGLAFVGGGVLYLFLSRRGTEWANPRRRSLRGLHMAGGAVAVALALTHHLGRWAQEGAPNFGLEPPHLSGVGFLLLAVSGFLRVAPPRAWRKRWRLFTYGHRAAFALALIMLVLHGLYEFRRFG